MPSVQDRSALGSEELPEAVLTGPFGGVQSELPLTQIEALGFADVGNIMFRKGAAYTRAGQTLLPTLPAPANEPIMGSFSFYNVNGVLVQGVFTPTRLLQFVSGAWTQITGPALTGTNQQLFDWDILNYKLCFSQGSNTLLLWDGIAATYSAVAGAPAVVKTVAEVGTHLIVTSPAFPNRYYWSGVGDPTDWTGFTSGLSDVVNNLGPIQYVIKIGQYGFGFHADGIVQIIPTGIGINPFAFPSIANASIGVLAVFSVDHYDDQGQELATYLGTDNVYVFNGTSIEPIGDMPLNDGSRRRLGARSRILADVAIANIALISGFNTYAIGGQYFRAYWLNIPGIALWVYNYDEGNWTRLTYSDILLTIGLFYNSTVVRIEDLVGPISAQNWTPQTLTNAVLFLGTLLGFADGVTAYLNFSQPCELPAYLTSGKLIFNDRRHKHTVKKFRVSFIDLGSVTFTLILANERGQSQTFNFTLGTGSGDVLNYVQEYNLMGLRFQYTLSVPANTLVGVVEIAPMYDTAGEQRGGANLGEN
jgi:hypothetical protein